MGSLRHGALRRLGCRAAPRLGAILFVVACGPREPALVNPGRSTANPLASSEARGAAAKPAESLGVDLDQARPVGSSFVSQGHFAGRWIVDVAVDPTARPIYTALNASSRFPVGSLLVKRHRIATPPTPGPVFAMIKHEAGYFPPGGDWEYVALDAEGALEGRGKLERCARCHVEGNGDWVFGLPADAR